VTPGQVLNITVGAGGAGGPGPYGTGGTGQPSTVTGTGVSFTADGGAGGTGGGNSGTGFGGIGAYGANYTSSFRVNAGGTSTNGGANGGNGGATKNAAGQKGGDGSVSIRFNITGAGGGGEAWLVPDGVKQLTVNYLTPSGFSTRLFPVTAGEVITVKLGDFGVASTITGTAGTLTLPAYDTQVFSYSGRVDHIIAQDVQVATVTPTSYSGSGSNATLTAGAAAAGITYNVTYEGWHGDLGATISITPVLLSTIYQPVQVYVKSGSGRQFPSAHTYQQQPSAANGYIMNDYQGDYFGDEGGYSWATNLRQQGYVTLDWQQPYLQSGWINVGQIYYKDGSNWTPVLVNSTINLNKIS